MAQYIDKDTVVAEIERQYNYLKEHPGTYGSGFILGFRRAGWQISDFINTFEVKEVELEKEIKNFTEDIFHKTFDEDKSQDDFWNDVAIVIEYTAKHFFELGLKVQKGE